MPLLREDKTRGDDDDDGGPSEVPSRPSQSFAEFLGLDNIPNEPGAESSAAINDRAEDWAWENPSSPEAAQTPRATVPATCFPPRHPRVFASYSESAQPGAASNEDGTDNGIRGLLSSLALTLPRAGSRSGVSRSAAQAVGYGMSVEPSWPPVQFRVQRRAENNRSNLPPRRASFCGVVGHNGTSAMRWSGQLLEREEEPDGEFSVKLFFGGLPWDITEGALMHALRHFHPVRVEWPGRENGGCPRGYAYVTLESERRVRALLGACRRERGASYYRLHSRKCRAKEVQVIPWALSDSNWASESAARLEAGRTVFVGALHGMLSAAALAAIMDDLFSGVIYAGIDTDKNKYPIGSGRVTFNNVRSYVRAISAAFVEIHTDKFSKKVQVDPYLEDSMCSVCNLQQGPYFCREPTCFCYFCRSCWAWQHSSLDHRPLMRNSKNCAPAFPLRPPAGAAPPQREPAPGYNGNYAQPSDGTPSPEKCASRGSGGSRFSGGSGGSGSGFSAGSASGFNTGSASGFNAGSASGFNAGSASGFNAGSASGFNAGSASGFNAGSASGFNAGSASGFNAGSASGFNAGSAVGRSGGNGAGVSGARDSGGSPESGASGFSRGSGGSDERADSAWSLH